MLIRISLTATVEVDPADYAAVVRSGESAFQVIERTEKENFDMDPTLIAEQDDFEVKIELVEE